MRARLLALCVLQALALIAFFASVVRADQVLPKSGIGDITLSETWNGRAYIALVVLWSVWIVGLASVLLHFRSQSMPMKQLLMGRLGGITAISVLVAPFGFIVGYVLIFIAV